MYVSFIRAWFVQKMKFRRLHCFMVPSKQPGCIPRAEMLQALQLEVHFLPSEAWLGASERAPGSSRSGEPGSTV